MVDAITPVSASSASLPVTAEKSMSIDSEPDNRYVAWRQAQINAALVATRLAGDHEATGDASLRRAEEEVDAQGENDPDRRGMEYPAEQSDSPDELQDEHTLSGESDHIGTVNFDDDTPFGDRTAFI